MISGRSDDVMPRTGNDTEKTSAVATDVQSISRTNSSSPTRASKTPRMIAPFVAAHDIPRGAIHALQALLGYVLMLAVMCVLRRCPFAFGRRTDCFFDLVQDIPGCLSHFYCRWFGFGRSSVREDRSAAHIH
jgi:hypothetical protein